MTGIHSTVLNSGTGIIEHWEAFAVISDLTQVVLPGFCSPEFRYGAVVNAPVPIIATNTNPEQQHGSTTFNVCSNMAEPRRSAG